MYGQDRHQNRRIPLSALWFSWALVCGVGYDGRYTPYKASVWVTRWSNNRIRTRAATITSSSDPPTTLVAPISQPIMDQPQARALPYPCIIVRFALHSRIVLPAYLSGAPALLSASTGGEYKGFACPLSCLIRCPLSSRRFFSTCSRVSLYLFSFFSDASRHTSFYYLTNRRVLPHILYELSTR